MNTGQYISGAAHLLLIGWVLIGGKLFRPQEPDFEFANVSLISSQEFVAMQEAAAPRAVEEPEPEPAPEPAPVSEPAPAPEPPPAPESPPEPEPEPEPAEAAPPPSPAPGSTVLTEAAEDPSPQEADIVAEAETEAPPEDVPESPDPVEAVTPDPAEAAPEPPVEVEAAAPPPTTTEIVTEADNPGAGEGALAPETSLRPRARPTALAARPVPAPEPTPAPAPEVAETAEPSLEDAIAAAAAEAVAAALAEAASATTSETGGAGIAAQGPPLTSGERDAFRLAVQGCWVVDPGSEASRVSVTVAFGLDQSGNVASGPDLIADSGGSEAAVRTAYEAARRAILRCQRGGFPLPVEKYEQWREVEMTFDAGGRQIR